MKLFNRKAGNKTINHKDSYCYLKVAGVGALGFLSGFVIPMSRQGFHQKAPPALFKRPSHKLLPVVNNQIQHPTSRRYFKQIPEN